MFGKEDTLHCKNLNARDVAQKRKWKLVNDVTGTKRKTRSITYIIKNTSETKTVILLSATPLMTQLANLNMKYEGINLAFSIIVLYAIPNLSAFFCVENEGLCNILIPMKTSKSSGGDQVHLRDVTHNFDQLIQYWLSYLII